jgi:hypothetical protein
MFLILIFDFAGTGQLVEKRKYIFCLHNSSCWNKISIVNYKSAATSLKVTKF